MKEISNNSVSLAGEFAVLSQLSLHGYDANMTLGHTKGIDILVHSPKKGGLYKLEVKTSSNKASVSKVFGKSVSEWRMNKKHESIDDPTLFYCFVSIPQDSSAFKFYIVPSKVVARYVAKQHKLWLRQKKKEGKRVKDTDMRVFRIGLKGQKYSIVTPRGEQFENNWVFAD